MSTQTFITIDVHKISKTRNLFVKRKVHSIDSSQDPKNGNAGGFLLAMTRSAVLERGKFLRRRYSLV